MDEMVFKTKENGGLLKDTETPKEQDKPEEQDKPAEPDMTRPMLGIDNIGNMTLYIPLTRTQEVVSRGMVDMARSELLKWYAAAAQRNREMAALAAKTGFQRFKDKIMGSR